MPFHVAAAVVTGSSFNRTKMAERQSADSLFAIQSCELTAQYTRKWEAGRGR